MQSDVKMHLIRLSSNKNLRFKKKDTFYNLFSKKECRIDTIKNNKD